MVKKSRGFRQSTRKKMRQRRGVRPSIVKFLQKFKEGEMVQIVFEPSSQRGMPVPRFSGRVGRVSGKRGNGYLIKVKDGSMVKTVISRPEHLKKA